MLKQSPWSIAIENGIDSLADWLIPTLGHAEDFSYFNYGMSTLSGSFNAKAIPVEDQ